MSFLSSKVRKPHPDPALWLVIYGDRGIGKTTTALGLRRGKTLIVAFENVDVLTSRLEDPPDIIDAPKTTHEIEVLFRELATPGHGYETVIIDSITALDELVNVATVEKHYNGTGVRALSAVAGGFNRAAGETLDLHRRLSNYLQIARNNGTQIILIGHAKANTVKPPDADPYNRMGLSLTTEGSANAWLNEADLVGYMFQVTATVERKGDTVRKATGISERRIGFVGTASYEAKNRIEGLAPGYILHDKELPFREIILSFGGKKNAQQAAPAQPAIEQQAAPAASAMPDPANPTGFGAVGVTSDFTRPEEAEIVRKVRGLIRHPEHHDNAKAWLTNTAGYSAASVEALFQRIAAEENARA